MSKGKKLPATIDWQYVATFVALPIDPGTPPVNKIITIVRSSQKGKADLFKLLEFCFMDVSYSGSETKKVIPMSISVEDDNCVLLGTAIASSFKHLLGGFNIYEKWMNNLGKCHYHIVILGGENIKKHSSMASSLVFQWLSELHLDHSFL